MRINSINTTTSKQNFGLAYGPTVRSLLSIADFNGAKIHSDFIRGFDDTLRLVAKRIEVKKGQEKYDFYLSNKNQIPTHGKNILSIDANVHPVNIIKTLAETLANLKK